MTNEIKEIVDEKEVIQKVSTFKVPNGLVFTTKDSAAV